MGIKEKTKSLLGRVRCRINHIIPFRDVYIGRNVKIKGGASIHLSEGVSIRPYVYLWSNGDGISIGKGTELGERCRISIANELFIGSDVLLSPNVYVTDCDHAYTDISIPVINQGIVNKDNRVSIGDGSYIGINSVIVGNVKIGKHCIIGANSVVTKDIPDYCVAVGNPVRIIKRYDWTKSSWLSVN